MNEEEQRITKKGIYSSCICVSDYIPSSICVYFIANEDGCIKIGKTRNLRKRMTDLQVIVPQTLRLMGFIEVEENKLSEAETLYHQLFSFCHIKGEWFEELPVLDFLFYTDRLIFPGIVVNKELFREAKKTKIESIMQMRSIWWNNFRPVFLKGEE